MQFPLSDGDGAACAGAMLGVQGSDVGLEFGEVVEAVVGDAQRADLAGFLGGDEGVPSSEAGGTATVGSVDEVQVYKREGGLREG